MQLLKAVAAAAVLLSMALAGCSGSGGDGGGFSISGSGLTYRFKASASADNYTWDLGDHLTRAYTKTVEHTYDFENGVVPVTLVATKDGKKTEHRKQITLGTGENENAGFVLEGSTNWTVLGESVTFSAHRSTDPDGDPLRYTWSCQRTGDAIRQSAHAHPGFGGVPFASPPAGSVLSIDAQGPLPAANRTVSGDLCEGLGTGGRPSLDTTVTGAFTRSGIYDIYLLASDPVHPTTSGKYRIVVTPPSEKPNETQVQAFDGTLLVGSNGAVQSTCETVPCDRGYDLVTHPFSLSLAAQQAWLTLEYEDATDQIVVTCTLKRGESNVIGSVSGPDGNATLPAANLSAGSYQIECQPNAVVPTDPEGLPYTVTFIGDLDMDPFKVY